MRRTNDARKQHKYFIKAQSPKGEKGVHVNLCVDVNLCDFHETPSPSSFARAVQKMSRYML